MCGIAGSVRLGGAVDREDVLRQLRFLEHCGPDSAGAFAAGEGAVGQTRLAVIDLRRGDPPITDESGDIGVALNGEICNFAEMRRELLADGAHPDDAGRHRGHRASGRASQGGGGGAQAGRHVRVRRVGWPAPPPGSGPCVMPAEVPALGLPRTGFSPAAAG